MWTVMWDGWGNINHSLFWLTIVLSVQYKCTEILYYFISILSATDYRLSTNKIPDKTIHLTKSNKWYSTSCQWGQSHSSTIIKMSTNQFLVFQALDEKTISESIQDLSSRQKWCLDHLLTETFAIFHSNWQIPNMEN